MCYRTYLFKKESTCYKMSKLTNIVRCNIFFVVWKQVWKQNLRCETRCESKISGVKAGVKAGLKAGVKQVWEQIFRCESFQCKKGALILVTWLLWFGQSWFWVVFVMRCRPIFLDFLLVLTITLTLFFTYPRRGRYCGRYVACPRGIGFVCASWFCLLFS